MMRASEFCQSLRDAEMANRDDFETLQKQLIDLDLSIQTLKENQKNRGFDDIEVSEDSFGFIILSPIKS